MLVEETDCLSIRIILVGDICVRPRPGRQSEGGG